MSQLFLFKKFIFPFFPFFHIYIYIYLFIYFGYRPDRGHLRTICKARSIVDYAWDNLYAPKLLTLQVFENKSHSYDPQKIGMGPPLVYDNDVYIKLVHSFDKYYLIILIVLNFNCCH